MTIASRIPVIAAPMAGAGSTPELAAAVSEAGGLGFLAGGYLSADALSDQLRRARERTARPLGVNLFVPGPATSPGMAEYESRMRAEAIRYGVSVGSARWEDDGYPAKVELVLAERVPVVSFTFGCPGRETVRELRDAGTEVVVSVTSPAEARMAAEAGADALTVQGMEAGGHRAVFTDDRETPGGGPLYGVLAALRLVAAEVELPLIGAGGITRGEDVAAVLSAGAVAAQLGTAFLVCPEAGTSPVHRAELLSGRRETALTRAFTGLPARGLVNRFLREHSDSAPAAYPHVHHLTKPIRSAAANSGDPEGVHLWAGQNYSLVRPMAARELVELLAYEARHAVRSAGRLLGKQ